MNTKQHFSFLQRAAMLLITMLVYCTMSARPKPFDKAADLSNAIITDVDFCYLYTGEPINITPTVLDSEGNPITLNRDYTVTLNGNEVSSFPFSVVDKGNYELVFTGIFPYKNTQTLNFSVSDHVEGLSIDNSYSEGQVGYYYVNMPANGTKEIYFLKGQTPTIKVYDNGGKYENISGNIFGKYSNNCDGILVLTAPKNYVLQLSGNIASYSRDYFSVHDGSNTTAPKLIDNMDGQKEITPIHSSGRSLMLHFTTNDIITSDGLDLTVEVLDEDLFKPHNINVASPITGGTVTASIGATNVTTAYRDDIVTLSATPEEGYLLSNIIVKDANDSILDVDYNSFSNSATFRMPAANVTVTPTFTNVLTADGGLCVNMPRTGCRTDIIPEGVLSFKLHDNGGPAGNYHANSNDTLVLTAPEGYVLQLTGSITTETGQDYLTVYDNSEASGEKLLNGVSGQTDISNAISSGRSLTLFFHSNDATELAGFDLTVTLINISTSTKYNIDIATPATGGTVVASLTSAIPGQTITITASPTSGYRLNNIIVTDSADNIVPVVWEGSFSNTATFRMPAGNVTVTPTFTNTLTAEGGLCAIVPVTGSWTVAVPEGIPAFKVYDAGGVDRNYSDNSDGTLTLTAPEGYVLQLTGGITTESGQDYLTVYDNDEASGEKLINGWSGTATIGNPIVSSGRSMTFCFSSNLTQNDAGLDLTVSLISTSTPFGVSIDGASGGTVAASFGGLAVTTAKVNDIVTLTATPNSGYILSSITVTDADGHIVPVVWDGMFFNTATFKMPASSVTVTPTFNGNLTVSSGVYVNMPATGTKTLTLPEGVQTFKLYDNGGEGGSASLYEYNFPGNYSDNCDGTLTLTAPEGCVLQIKGSISIDSDYDYLSIYDGSNTSATVLIDKIASYWGNNYRGIPTVISSGRSLTLYFYSNYSRNHAGLDLTVSVVNTNTSYNINVNNYSTNCEIAASSTSAKVNETVTLTATPATGYLLTGISVKDADGDDVPITWDGLFSNTATFQMPTTSVIVTPTFSTNITDAFSINMPTKGKKYYSVPLGIHSFKVYDNGGAGGSNRSTNASGNYTDKCDGQLILTAPEDCRLQVSGTIVIEPGGIIDGKFQPVDYLSVYDGTSYYADSLFEDECCEWGKNEVVIKKEIPTVTSTGQYMTLFFFSDSYGNYEGLDLTITVIPKYAQITLDENSNNTTAVSDNDHQVADVKMNNRTIYKDGSWNTLCLPFSLSAAEIEASVLKGAVIKELNGTTSNLTDGILTLNFKDANSISAGKPYIIKWNKPEADLVIHNEADWDAFVYALNNTQSFEGQLVQLNADISITKMAGCPGHPFMGTFDGGGHTITANLSGNGEGTALFYRIDYANIQNVIVEGNITTVKYRPASIASFANNSTIRNCWSKANISSTIKNSWVDGGGFVGRVSSGYTLQLIDCAFTGTITYDPTAGSGGAMVGYTQPDAKAYLTRCLFAPTNLTLGTKEYAIYTFVSGNYHRGLTQCYYNSVAKSSILSCEGTDASGMDNASLLSALGNNWTTVGDNVVPKTDTDLLLPVKNPEFNEVTIDASATTEVNFNGGKFVGTYSPVNLAANDKSVLFIGTANTLHWPDENMRINACRAYFQLDSGQEAHEFVLNTGEGNATGITETHFTDSTANEEAWYTLDGRRLNGKPTQKGVYIYKGKKVKR